MQTAPTGGAAGTGVSEAKLKASPGHVEPVAVTDLNSLSKSVQLSVITDVVSLSGVADLSLLSQAPIGDGVNVRAVAAADLLKLAQILQPVHPPERAVRVDNLIREIVNAIHEGRIEFAVGRLIEAATVDPTRVDEIRSMPELEAIRANVEYVVAHLTHIAKADAEAKLTSAEQLFERGDYRKLAHWQTAPSDLLRIGHKLIEAGGYVNYLRTAELATTLQSAYSATAIDSQFGNRTGGNPKKDGETLKRKGAQTTTVALVRHAWVALHAEIQRAMRSAWRRAPLLVLIGGWFVLGIVGGLLSKLARMLSPEAWIVVVGNFGFDIWGLGFMVLIGMGFWAGVRKRGT
jgi:hypothetical protein